MPEKYFIVMESGKSRERYFPDELIAELKKTGTVEMNPFPREITEPELCELAISLFRSFSFVFVCRI